MADLIVDGYTRVAFVPTIANNAAPTTAELNAGTLLHNTLIVGGLQGFAFSPGEVDNTAFGSSFDTKLPGVSGYSGTQLVLKKQTIGSDTIWTLLTTFFTAGYIVIRDGVLNGTAWGAGNNVEVFPITTGDWEYMERARNEVLKYMVACPIGAAPTKKAVVV
jgi:hypothetical protein